MSFDDRLREMLLREAESLPPPRFALDQAMGRGTERRGHRWMMATAAAGGVLAVSVVAAMVLIGGPPAVEQALDDTTVMVDRLDSVPSTSASATTSLVETTVATEPTILVWSATEARRDVTNLLAALEAGAFEQAAYAATKNVIAIPGQQAGETTVEALERLCQGGACAGPYEVVEATPGTKTAEDEAAGSVVEVVNTETGERVEVRLEELDGEVVVPDLPPLTPSSGGPGLVEKLFGEDLPQRVVVERFDAYEIWQDGEVEWVTNRYAGEAYQVEGDILATPEGMVDLYDPEVTYPGKCVELITRDGEVLAVERCDSASWRVFEPESGRVRRSPVRSKPSGEGAYPVFYERNGVVLEGVGDSEGNLSALRNLDGVDLLGDDWAGILALSVDGARVAYVDHRDPAAHSHFWSAVLVVKDTGTGVELGRWVLDGPILDLEFAVDWVVAGLTDMEGVFEGDPDQVALVSINLGSGELRQVDTPVRLFLPS